MASLEILKLSTDGLLVLAIVFLCYRILMSGSISSRSAKLVMLESSLKGLIREADGASRSLHDELTRRQHSLERLLSDLTAVEGRLSLMQESMKTMTTSAQPAAAKTRSVEQYREEEAQEAPEAPEAPSFMATRKTAPQAAQHAASQVARSVKQTATDVRALARQIEISREKSDQRIETIDEVQSQAAPERPQPAQKAQPEQKSQAAADARLGVLGGMKRQIQTL